MDLQRSILNKTNAESKPNSFSSPNHHNAVLVDDSILGRSSHFSVKTRPSSQTERVSPTKYTPPPSASSYTASLMSSRSGPEQHNESTYVSKPVHSRAPDEYSHSNYKPVAMSNPDSDPTYAQQSIYTAQQSTYHPQPIHQPEPYSSNEYWNHRHLYRSPPRQPIDYRRNDLGPSVPTEDAATIVNGAATPQHGEWTDLDSMHSNDHHRYDTQSYVPPPLSPAPNRRHGQVEMNPTEAAAAFSTTNFKQSKPRHLCQFEDPRIGGSGSCKEWPNGDENARKVVSHIFGRNKKATQSIPEELWCWYCRKHYQRYRYDLKEQWPQKQVELVRAALDNFEQWGQIQCWNVILRKREQVRQETAYVPDDEDDGSEFFDYSASPHHASSSTTAARGRYMRIRRSKKAQITAAASAGRLDEALLKDPSFRDERDRYTERTATGRRKARPKNLPCPVPDFVREYLGDGKSYEEVRQLIDRIEIYIQGKDKSPRQLAEEEEAETVYGKAPEPRLFPDIELLPVFTSAYQLQINKKGAMGKKRAAPRRPAYVEQRPFRTSATPSTYTSAANMDQSGYQFPGHEYQYPGPASALNQEHRHQQQQPLPQKHHAHAHVHIHHTQPLLPPLSQFGAPHHQFNLPPLVSQQPSHMPWGGPSARGGGGSGGGYPAYIPSPNHDFRGMTLPSHPLPTKYPQYPLQQQQQQHQQQHDGRAAGLSLPSLSSQLSLPPDH